MRRLRLASAFLFVWLFVLYNLERLPDPIELSSFVYVLAGICAAPMIFVPRLARLSPIQVIVGAGVLVPAVKYALGYSLGGPAVTVTIAEVCVVVVTTSLAHAAGRVFTEFQDAVVTTFVRHLSEDTRPYEQGLEEMYREVRRARAFKRPFTLLALAPTDESVNVSLDRFTEEVYRDAVDHYVNARLAQLLSKSTKSSDVIVRVKDHFVMLLPETGRHQANRLIRKVRMIAKSQLGLDLAIGSSAFPHDEVTFVKLLERAQARMDRGSVADLMAVVSQEGAGVDAASVREQSQPTADGSTVVGVMRRSASSD